MRTRAHFGGVLACSAVALLGLGGCSPGGSTSASGPPGTIGGAGGGGGTTGPGPLGAGGNPGFFAGLDAGVSTSEVDGGSVCGNGKVEGHETCDDANVTPADGCAADCTLESGWTCPVVGERCVAAACGDGIVAGTEPCDDGNTADGDGCSGGCRREPGWACTSASPMVCHATTCGDGTTEGFEQCDDGNRIPYDGCSPTCASEPHCSGGQCTAVCGDGLKFPQEDCDDGNTVNGDGCSSSCTVEGGYTCSVTTLSPADQLVIPILYRDFLYAGTTTPGPGHPDFEAYGAGATGLVQSTLGADGIPVFASSTGNGTSVSITDATSFYWWYHEEQCAPDGTCTPNPYEKLVAADASGAPMTLTLGHLPSGAYQFDSSSFFPINGLGWGSSQLWLGVYNFSFTSELRYVFTYQGGEVFNFRGDDDVWVFINGKLAVDLGGLHGPESGSITLDSTAAGTLGLTIGGMYEICVFQAERHTVGSNYQLTLSGFVHATSTCASVCGDKVVTPDEVCDDGLNDGSYGGCMPGCQARGPYCGDAKVDAANGEACDDGNTQNGDNCTSSCRLPSLH